MFKTTSRIVVIVFGFFMFFIFYSNWQMEKEFITSEKGRTLGTIHIEKGVQTINFPENNYGVAFKGSKREEGERVYIYFQKNKPYRISTSKNHYQPKKEVYGPIASGIFLIGSMFSPNVKSSRQRSRMKNRVTG